MTSNSPAMQQTEYISTSAVQSTQLNRNSSPRSSPARLATHPCVAATPSTIERIGIPSPTKADETTLTVINPFDASPGSETVIIEGTNCLDTSSIQTGRLVQPRDHQNLYPSSTDIPLSQQHPPLQYHHYDTNNELKMNQVGCKLRGGDKTVALVVNDRIIENNAVECDKDKDNNNKNRRSTVTKGESIIWGENASHHDNIDNYVESNAYHHNAANNYHLHAMNTTSHREQCLDCLIRVVRRVCHSHTHPPCSRRYWSNSNNNNNTSQQHRRRLSPRYRRILCRSLIILFMIVTITFTLLDLLILHQHLHHWLDSTLEWLHNNPILGGLAFIGIILMGCLCFFPVALLSLGAGYVYIELYGLGLGIFVAFLVCFSGYLLGAVVCFARSRYLMRQLIIRYSVKYPIVRAVDRAFETKGFRLLLLLRLSPALPMNALNYIGGITAISFSSYWWASCIGMFPGLLWTIFVGATFGTVDARGVDGNEEFDRNSVRKAVVLGLGIGIGVMALIGTAIYARMELKKIILAEQMERAIQEQELFLHDDEIEVGREDGEDADRDLTLFDTSENPQTGDWDNISFDSIEHGREGLPTNRRRVSSHGSLTTLERHRGITQHPWTPETLDAELPILPKVIIRCFPRPNVEVATTDHERREETPNYRRRGQSHSSDTAKLNADASRNIGVNTTSPTSRRHLDGVSMGALMVTPERALRTDTSLEIVNDMMSSLANIYETRALSDDQLFDEVDGEESHTVASPYVSNENLYRRRCNTDPTDRRNREYQDLDVRTDDGISATQRKKRWQQSSPAYTTPPKQQQGMKSRHSLGSLHTEEVILKYGDECSPIRPRCNSLNTHLPQGKLQHHSSISLPHELSPAGGHVGLDISGRDDVDDDSTDTPREWFWIWS